jgi:hypothetical protein
MDNLTRIEVRHGDMGYLCKLFKKSRPFVRKALRGESRDFTALKIRKAAMERDGAGEYEPTLK